MQQRRGAFQKNCGEIPARSTDWKKTARTMGEGKEKGSEGSKGHSFQSVLDRPEYTKYSRRVGEVSKSTQKAKNRRRGGERGELRRKLELPAAQKGSKGGRNETARTK